MSTSDRDIDLEFTGEDRQVFRRKQTNKNILVDEGRAKMGGATHNSRLLRASVSIIIMVCACVVTGCLAYALTNYLNKEEISSLRRINQQMEMRREKNKLAKESLMRRFEEAAEKLEITEKAKYQLEMNAIANDKQLKITTQNLQKKTNEIEDIRANEINLQKTLQSKEQELFSCVAETTTLKQNNQAKERSLFANYEALNKEKIMMEQELQKRISAFETKDSELQQALSDKESHYAQCFAQNEHLKAESMKQNEQINANYNAYANEKQLREAEKQQFEKEISDLQIKLQEATASRQ